MVVAAVVCVLGLAVVLLVLYTDGPLESSVALEPDWDLLPSPAEVGRSDFRLAFPGYDPASVETHLERLRRAYADLMAVAPPEVLQRARQRAAVRAGLDPEEYALPGDPPGPRRVRGVARPVSPPPASWTVPPNDGPPEFQLEAGSSPEAGPEPEAGEDLRLEAALAAVDDPAPTDPTQREGSGDRDAPRAVPAPQFLRGKDDS